MNHQEQEQRSVYRDAIGSAYPTIQPPAVMLTVAQFADRHPAWTQAAIRNLIHKAESRHSSKGNIPGNGLIEAGAIVRLGRKGLIDEQRFFVWIEAQRQSGK